MKTKTILLFTVILFACSAIAQTNTFPAIGAAGIGTVSPDPSSLLDVKSTTKGVLIPRMSQAQRDAIITPVTGLLIFQTNNTPGFYYYTGTAWTAISTKGANTALSNLKTPTAINASLLPNANNAFDLGSSSLNWKNIFAGSYFIGGNKVFDLSGIDNTFIGNIANTANVGTDNLFAGFHAGKSNKTGSHNVAVGANAFSSDTANSFNVAIGDSALYSLNGNANISRYLVAVGFNALNKNKDAGGNTAVGANSLYSNTTGESNTAIGTQSLYNNIDGFSNTADGNSALRNNTSGFYNVAVGELTLGLNTTGKYNVATGESALFSNTTGSYNVADGSEALISNISGSHNTSIGAFADVDSDSLTNTTAIGANAFASSSNSLVLGSISGINGANSSVNVGIGTSSPLRKLHVVEIGSSGGTPNPNTTIIMEKNGTSYFQILTPNANENGILFGLASNAASGGIIYNNSSLKGLQFRTGGNNTRVRIDSVGRVSIGDFAATHRLQLNVDDAAKPSTSTWTIASDEKLKTNISDFKEGLDVVKKIHPVWFEYNGKADLPKGVKSVGIVAQEMQKIAPYMIGKYKYIDTLGNKSEYLDYNANALFYLLVNSVKELSVTNDEQRSEIQDLRSEVEELKQMMLQLQQNFSGCSPCATSSINTQSSTLKQPMLEQNIPNPFNGTTTIGYYVPPSNSSAYINFYAASGALLKSVKLDAKGSGTISIKANELAAGVYQYALVVDGKVVDRKQMVQSK